MLHLPHAGVPGAAAASQVTPATVEAFVELESSNFRTTFVTGRVTLESSSSEQDVLASDGEHRLNLQMQPKCSGKSHTSRRSQSVRLRPTKTSQFLRVFTDESLPVQKKLVAGYRVAMWETGNLPHSSIAVQTPMMLS